jgi:hypothetical protein
MAIQKDLFEKGEKYYYIAIDDEERGFGHLIYEKFKISEIEMIKLIKILYVDRRFVSVGKKLLDVYNDSTGYTDLTLEKLKQIGIGVKENEPKRDIGNRTI